MFVMDKNGKLRLTEDQDIPITWDEKNKPMLAAMGFTKRIVEEKESRWRPLNPLTGIFDGEEIVRVWTSKTIPDNPLYKDYDGVIHPAIYSFQAGTEFRVCKIGVSLSTIHYVDLQVTECVDKKLKRKSIRIYRDVILGLKAEMVG